MRTILSLFFLTLFAVLSQAQPDAIDSALSALNITRAEFRVDPSVMITRSGTSHRLPIFDQWFQDPLSIPRREHYWREAMLSSNGELHALFNNCSSILSVGTRRDLIPPTPIDKYRARAQEPHALKDAILSLDPAARIHGLSDVPASVQTLAAMVLYVTGDAIAWRSMALRSIPEEEWPVLFASLAKPLETSIHDTLASDTLFPDSYEHYYEQLDALGDIDLSLLMAAGDDLTAVVDTVASEFAAMTLLPPFAFNCVTRYGVIRINSKSDNEYGGEDPILLVLDASGDDHYLTGGGSRDADHPVSIIIDAAGDDWYQMKSGEPSFGAGILGFGIVAEMSGNDKYESNTFYSQGCGVAGIGLLHDAAGDDSYSGIGATQGFGMFGVGILSDNAGNDSYRAFIEGQGCGMTMGFGLLCDGRGNDIYSADDSAIIFPSAQSDKHNTSMCQGAGYGPRRDYLDAHSLAGGVGMLLDGAGDDQYSGGVFSQAVGYWYGIGVLDDVEGDDQYHSVWYGQSATAHMGLSYLHDGAGDDAYTATMSVSTGAAHDLSASIFLDEEGNDRYVQSGNSLGRALNSSVALFADLKGDDHYEGTQSLGRSANFSSSGWRAETWTTSLFLDLEGNDTYPPEAGRDDSTWVQDNAGELPLLRGTGLDTDSLKIRWD